MSRDRLASEPFQTSRNYFPSHPPSAPVVTSSSVPLNFPFWFPYLPCHEAIPPRKSLMNLRFFVRVPPPLPRTPPGKANISVSGFCSKSPPLSPGSSFSLPPQFAFIFFGCGKSILKPPQTLNKVAGSLCEASEFPQIRISLFSSETL